MAILPIRMAGDPVLRQKARKVKTIDDATVLSKFVDTSAYEFVEWHLHLGAIHADTELNAEVVEDDAEDGSDSPSAVSGAEIVEVSDTGIYQAKYDVDAIQLPKIATDDSHRDADFGRAWVEVDAARSADAILRAIKAGDFRVGFAAADRPPGA